MFKSKGKSADKPAKPAPAKAAAKAKPAKPKLPPDMAPATNDAYTGMLTISLLALLGGAALLYLDYQQYPTAKPPALPQRPLDAPPDVPGGGLPPPGGGIQPPGGGIQPPGGGIQPPGGGIQPPGGGIPPPNP